MPSSGTLLRTFLAVLAAGLVLLGLNTENNLLHDSLMIGLAAALAGSIFLWSRRDRALEARYRLYFEHAMVGMASSTLDHRWLQVNPALCKILGYSAEELIGRSWEEFTHPDDLAVSRAKFDLALRGEIDGYELQKRYIRADGEIIDALIAAQVLRKKNGEIEGFVLMVEDITARQQATRKVERLEKRANMLLELPEKASQLDEADFVAYAAQRIAQITESASCQLTLPGRDNQLAPVDWCRPALENHHPVFRQETGLHSTCLPVIEEQLIRVLAIVEHKRQSFSDTDLESIRLLASETWRIVRRQRAEKALKIATQVVNASPVVCFRWQASAQWPVVFVSENISIWGYNVDDLLAGEPPFSHMIHPDDLKRVTQEVITHIAEGCNEFVQEYRLLTADKQVIWVVDRTTVQRDEAGHETYFDGVLTDITERKQQAEEMSAALLAQRQLNKRLEEAHNQLLQSEKMASIGQLAAGIAHELNNPIGFVHSNLGTLESYLRDLMEIVDTYDRALNEMTDAQSPTRAAIARLREDRDFAFMREDIVQLLAESKDGLARVRKIVLDLKGFSHVSEQEWQWADLHAGLDSTLNIVWNELKYKCKVVKEYGDIPKVYCLISQLNQVFMNLLVNAGHAIEQSGTITIRTFPHGEDAVRIEITDTGKGIAPEHLDRIFEPFFTTKPIGKGTGLGLSLSYGIIDKHHGQIDVESQPGVGTTFRIILPIQPEPPPATATSLEASA